MTTATLLSIQVGQPRRLGFEGASDPFDQPWTSGIHKTAVSGAVHLSVTGLAGDGHVSASHGGPDKAVLMYAAAHYTTWRDELGIPALEYGSFGENLVVDGLIERTVCLGDRYRIGEVLLEVSHPRQPCHTLARKFRMGDMVARVAKACRPGWYARVIAPGDLVAGLPVDLVARPHPFWTIERCARTMEQANDAWLLAADLACVPELAATWRRMLLSKAAEASRSSAAQRAGAVDGRVAPVATRN